MQPGAIQTVYQAESGSGTNPAADVAQPGSTIVGPFQQSLGFQQQYSGDPGLTSVNTDPYFQAVTAGSYLSGAEAQGATETQALNAYEYGTSNPLGQPNTLTDPNYVNAYNTAGSDVASQYPGLSFSSSDFGTDGTGISDFSGGTAGDTGGTVNDIMSGALGNTAAGEVGTGQGVGNGSIPDAATTAAQIASSGASWWQQLIGDIENLAARAGLILIALILLAAAAWALSSGEGRKVAA